MGEYVYEIVLTYELAIPKQFTTYLPAVLANISTVLSSTDELVTGLISVAAVFVDDTIVPHT